MKRVLLVALAAVFGSLLAQNERALASTITNDTVNKVVTMSGTNYTLKLNYNGKSRVTSFVVNGQETIDQVGSEGIYTASLVGGTWYTSQGGVVPAVSVLGSTVTETFSTAITSETWTFTVSDPSVTLQIQRVYNGSYTVTDQGSPMISFAEHSFDNIRTPGDGGNIPIDGNVLNVTQSKWLATGTKLDTNSRIAKEQVNYSLLSEPTNSALKISGTTNHDALSRGRGTQFYRADITRKNLRLSIVTSGNGLTYANSPYGYAGGTGAGGLYNQGTGAPVYQPVTVSNGSNDTVTLTFAPDTYANYFDVGNLKGVDQYAISRLINVFGRSMMQDQKRGASFEGAIKSAEVPPLEMQSIGQLVELFPDSVNAFKAGLNDIRDYLQDPTTGEVKCCRPGIAIPWGIGRPDETPGYVLGVISAFAISGDSTWLIGMKSSVEKALDYTIANQMDPTTKRLKFALTNDCSHCGVYWEVTAGTYSGYATAMMYEALTQWALLESNVLSDSTHATTYNGTASTMQSYFNLDLPAGGFWSKNMDSFYSADGVADTAYLPTIGAVLKSGITTQTRMKRMVDSYENLVMRNNDDVHGMNYFDIYNSRLAAPDDPPSQNGSWYGGPDGDFYVGLPLLNDPVKIPTYIAALTNRYYADGFYNCSGNYSRMNYYNCGVADGDYGFTSTMMPVWGLYHSTYGFQPRYNELVLAPLVPATMVGSVVKYTWRQQPISVTYNSKTSFTIQATVLPTNIRVEWINQTAGVTYHYTVDGGASTVAVADSNGTVQAVMSAAGTHTYVCTDCAVTTAASGGTSYVTGVNLNGAPLRNDANMDIGMKLTTGSSNIVINELGRYYVTGNKRAHLLKLIDASSGAIIAATSVNMAEGTADALGFKYGQLGSSVTLLANHSYYLMSTEVNGGDQWYDTSLILTTTGVASVNSAGYGMSGFNVVGGSQNSYGPLNFKYSTFASTTATDDSSASITYTGSWSTTTNAGYYNGTTHFTNTPGDYLQFTFTGTSVRFLGGTYSDHGKIDVYIDGVSMTPSSIEMYTVPQVRSTLLYSKNGLTSGSHTIKIVLSANRNPASSNFYLDADKFEVSS